MSYCTKTEVNSLFGDISDEITDEMFNTVIANSTAWIDSNLRKNYVPIPEITVEEATSTTEEDTTEETDEDDITSEVDETETETETETTVSVTQSTIVTYNLINVPNGLRAAAIYYAASDVLLSLYHGDDLPVQYDVWFNKAQSLLNDYITAYINSDADESDLVNHQPVKHSHSLTYNQKRRRRGWVR